MNYPLLPTMRVELTVPPSWIEKGRRVLRTCLTCHRQTCDRQPEDKDPADCKFWKSNAMLESERVAK